MLRKCHKKEDAAYSDEISSLDDGFIDMAPADPTESDFVSERLLAETACLQIVAIGTVELSRDGKFMNAFAVLGGRRYKRLATVAVLVDSNQKWYYTKDFTHLLDLNVEWAIAIHTY
jgi:hypothetical protein